MSQTELCSARPKAGGKAGTTRAGATGAKTNGGKAGTACAGATGAKANGGKAGTTRAPLASTHAVDAPGGATGAKAKGGKKPKPRKKKKKPAAAAQSPISTLLLCNGDALESCLFMLDTAEELCAVAAVCTDFHTAVRRLLDSSAWRAAHLSLHDLLAEAAVFGEPAHTATIAARVLLFPQEVVQCGGVHRLPPLHIAAITHAPLSVVNVLLSTGDPPGAAARKRTRGRLPHHTASLHGAHDALAALVAVFAHGTSQRDGDGCLPLHLAASAVAASGDAALPIGAERPSGGATKPSDDAARVTALLLDANPDSASEVDLSGMLPLHYAALHGAPVAVVRLLLAAFATGVQHEASHGWTPLTLAIVYGSSADVLAALLGAWPDGARSRIATLDALPLHLAAKHHAPAKILRLLLAAYPDAITEVDGDGRLPLHLATAHRADADAIGTLLHADSSACAVADADGYLPLHHAVCNEVSSEAVEALLHAYPHVATVAVSGARLPLHLACANHAPAAAVRALLRLYPHAARCAAADGYLPLHTASESGASAAVANALLLAHPAGARQRTRLGRLPLQLVARRGIVETDAEDVSSRRSTSGGAAHAAMQTAPLATGSARAHAAGGARDSTWRGEEAMTHHLCRHHVHAIQLVRA